MKAILLALTLLLAAIAVSAAPPPPIFSNPFSTNQPVNPITNSSPIYHLAILQVEVPSGGILTNFWGNSIDVWQLIPGFMQLSMLTGLEDSIIGVDSNGIIKKIDATAFSNNTNTIVSQLGPFTPLYIPVADGTNTLTDGPFFVSALGSPNAWLSGFQIYQGFSDGVDYSRLMVGHNGTNGAAVFNSTATGIAGPPRGFEFQSNGLLVAAIAIPSGYSGTGTKFLADDGHYYTVTTGGTGADPTAEVGLTPVNGTAPTFMRSDAAPRLESVGTPGTYGDASNFPLVTTDAAGRVTAVTTNPISAGQTNIAAANPTATIGLTAVNGTAPTFMRSDAAPALGAVGTPGTYGNATTFVAITTDAAGRVTAVTTHSVSAGQTNVAAANPTASIGLVAINGTAPTFMRSDAAPPIDQGITPTWTGIHSYFQNVQAVMTVGDTTFVDFNRATQTNAISGAFALSFATNGAHARQSTHLRKLLNSSGSDRTLSFPIAAGKVNGWLTNQLTGAIPPAITNDTAIYMLLRCDGPTDTLARQTNVMVLGFEYY